MKVPMSQFLLNEKDKIKKLVKTLEKEYAYISILGTDSQGFTYIVKKSESSINQNRWSERGFVARVYNGISYSEYSFNEFDDPHKIIEAIGHVATVDVDRLKKEGLTFIDYPLIDEEPIVQSFQAEVQTMAEDVSPETILDRLKDVHDQSMACADYLIDTRVVYDYLHVSKIFISTKKDLEQSYIWSTAVVAPIGKNGNGIKYYYNTFSGLKGYELLEDIDFSLDKLVAVVGDLLNAKPLIPGEYEIICDPKMSGLIAHEAFGHGVEMDMFVKNRAKAVQYMNKEVASSKVQMFDGASSAVNVSSYLFDDEGILGKSTQIIKDGILESGICDLLSSLNLGTMATGNGKRESFERKAYTRMTNTFFSPGSDSVDEMIQSVKKGYLLESFFSGMEDPKNWGIQCVAALGREIINGKLTGNVVSPVYLTGYVPDLLKSISLVSDNLELSGSGFCGKGHKEFVKTSTGGPYLKTLGRLA